MLNIWPALFDLSWILAAQKLAVRDAVVLWVPLGIYLSVRLGHFGIWQRLLVILLLAGATIWGELWGAVFGILAFLLAYLRRYLPHHTRYAYMAGVVAWSVLSLSHPHNAVLPLILVAVAIGGLLTEAWQRNRDSTLLLITGAATLGALCVTVLLWVIPWGFLITHTLGLAGGVLVSFLLTLMPKLKLRKKPISSTTTQGLHVLREHGKVHSFIGADILIIAAGMSVLLLMLWMMLSNNRRNALKERGATETVRVQLENLTTPNKPVFRRIALSPVRAAVKNRLKQAERQGMGKVPGQTFRQWVMAYFANNPHATDIARIYEEVRYDNKEDSMKKAQRLKKLWKTGDNHHGS